MRDKRHRLRLMRATRGLLLQRGAMWRFSRVAPGQPRAARAVYVREPRRSECFSLLFIS